MWYDIYREVLTKWRDLEGSHKDFYGIAHDCSCANILVKNTIQSMSNSSFQLKIVSRCSKSHYMYRIMSQNVCNTRESYLCSIPNQLCWLQLGEKFKGEEIISTYSSSTVQCGKNMQNPGKLTGQEQMLRLPTFELRIVSTNSLHCAFLIKTNTSCMSCFKTRIKRLYTILSTLKKS